jgi:isopentenyl phosphate kinase
MAGLVVLKLGGSVITKKGENRMEVDYGNLRRLCHEISSAKKKLNCRMLVVHGAGPFGHVLAEKYKLQKGMLGAESVKGMCETHASMEKLNHVVVEELNSAGVNAMAFQPSAGGILNNRRIAAFPTQALEKMLDLGIAPVGYGDVLIDLATGVNILSGDHLVAYLAAGLKAKRIVIATDVSGIFNGDPKRDSNAQIVKEISKSNVNGIAISGSQGVDVTGGMKRKVMELLEVAGKGIPSQVVSGIKPGELKKALLGYKTLGTLIR